MKNVLVIILEYGFRFRNYTVGVEKIIYGDKFIKIIRYYCCLYVQFILNNPPNIGFTERAKEIVKRRFFNLRFKRS